ncbi:hypothetical protein PROFUN_08800 [Planoprotostelium fungivorum]|uniref:Myb-like domain-containing protein n=1 Tax=Planoprotostelium fungivorum TaxID=1890364 RepID=A0A2P6MVY2_9EUKA|nr:hypothetical protein PROFUN_08800 [Planoprotostelium fungivorum]
MSRPQMRPNSKVVRSADSPSLWNYTLSPGWTKEEIEVLRLTTMKWGVGCWVKLCKSNCLPGKSASQLNLQLQRLMGQQSLAEYVGVHLDPRDVWASNNEKQGPDYRRKNGCIINTGNNPTREERLVKIEDNRKKFGLTQEQVDAIVIPTLSGSRMSAISNTVWEKKARLKQLKENLKMCEWRLVELNHPGELRPTDRSPASVEDNSSRSPKEMMVERDDDSDFDVVSKLMRHPAETKEKDD